MNTVGNKNTKAETNLLQEPQLHLSQAKICKFSLI